MILLANPNPNPIPDCGVHAATTRVGCSRQCSRVTLACRGRAGNQAEASPSSPPGGTVASPGSAPKGAGVAAGLPSSERT